MDDGPVIETTKETISQHLGRKQKDAQRGYHQNGVKIQPPTLSKEEEEQ